MADFHKTQVLTDNESWLWEMYNFITNASQTVVQFVTENGVEAVYIDTGETDKDLNENDAGHSLTHAGLSTSQIRLREAASTTTDAYYNATYPSTVEITDPGGLHDGETRTTTTTYDTTTRAQTVSSAWTQETLTGTHTTDTTVTLTGAGTAYSTELAVGDSITISGETVREVATIASDTVLTVTSAFSTSAGTLSGTLDNPRGGCRYRIYNTEASFATPSAKEAFGIGSYFVIEPTFANPGWSETGTSQSTGAGSTTEIILAAADIKDDDYYNGAAIEITAGTSNGDTRIISDYDGTTNTATVTVAFTAAPDTDSVYELTRRWQYRVERFSNNYFRSEGAPMGGFTIGSATTGGGFVTLTSGKVPCIDNFTPSASDTLYLSTGDSDTYSGGSLKYGWFRFMVFDNSANFVNHGVYAGGYIPFDSADTDPFVMLAGAPELIEGSGTGWSYDTATNNCDCRIPRENGTTVTDFRFNYASCSSNAGVHTIDDSQTRAGKEVAVPVYVSSIPDRKTVGYFGANTHVGASDAIANLTANTAGTRLMMITQTSGGIAIEWQP